MNRIFNKVWDQLRGKHPLVSSFLESTRIDGIRGLKNLNVRFAFPVSVIAGQNASGKSTVLFALACAYKVPGAGVRDYVPSRIFPNFKSRVSGLPADKHGNIITIDYSYRKESENIVMRWRRGKSWNKSFFGRKGGAQPERDLYLRTLSNISNPSEVRSFLTLGNRTDVDGKEIDAALIRFAEQILPFRYKRIVTLSRQLQDHSLLFAEQASGEELREYSEFHMSAGERAILHLSKDISKKRNALILIDEVEAGLHPYSQEKLMLQLQRMALRNDLQIVVTTHSEVVLESVPMEGRIFLERDESGARLVEPYKDIVKHALYGRTHNTLSILCEDVVAENILRGVFDYLTPELRLWSDSITIGRDTGSSEFVSHFRSIQKFGMENNFLFVLDGDAKDIAEKLRREKGMEESPSLPSVLTLPGNQSPETWIWEKLQKYSHDYAQLLSQNEDNFRAILSDKTQLYESATDTPSSIAKLRLESLGDAINCSVDEIARIVARCEAKQKRGEIDGFVNDLEDVIRQWRTVT